MFRKILALCVTAGCFCFSAVSAYAVDGAIGNAVDGVVDAGEDVADGIFRAGEDIVDGLSGGTIDGEGTGDLTDPDASNSSTNGGTISGNSGSNAIGNTSDITSGDNPYTGVTVGYAGITAVIAAMGVVVSSIRRKNS